MPSKASQNVAADVAVKVMGWKPIPYKYFTRYVKPNGDSVTVCTTKVPDLSSAALNWHPDTDIADAMMVREKVRTWSYEKQNWFVVHLERQKDEAGYENMRLEWWLIFTADLPPAICLAALAACEEGARAEALYEGDEPSG